MNNDFRVGIGLSISPVRAAVCLMTALALAGCAGGKVKYNATAEQINAELASAAEQRVKPSQPEAVTSALLPPLKIEMPKASPGALESKFDLVVNNAPANQVFMGIVSGTRYSMLVHPEVTGAISVNLKDVTVIEALDAIRELYGYEYTLEGTRIYIKPLTLQTRVFQVNYLLGQRRGRSDVRVTSGSISDVGGPGTTPTPGTTAPAPAAGTVSRSLESSRVTTSSDNDFWTEIASALKTIVGTEGGRNVIVSPQSGVIVVRALPADLRNVEKYLKATQVMVERQVMLEAKIIEVRLNDSYQTGINWAAFKTGPNSRLSAGVISPGTTLSPSGRLETSTARAPDGSLLANSTLRSDPAASLITGAATAGTLFGLAFQTGSFAALLSFLETQGTVHVLSSPRIATLNNQKAVLKVGTDEFFVTNVTSTPATAVGGGGILPGTTTVTVQPFFSGIALDVMPQIDEDGMVTLHVHPSVTTVIDKSKVLDLGSTGILNLPLASSTISETDSIVRVQDGNIVAIGGLMKQQQTDDRSQVPGAGDIPVLGGLFRNTGRSSVKSELVILLKPTVINTDKSWQQDILDTQQRIQTLERPQSKGADPGNKGQQK